MAEQDKKGLAAKCKSGPGSKLDGLAAPDPVKPDISIAICGVDFFLRSLESVFKVPDTEKMVDDKGVPEVEGKQAHGMWDRRNLSHHAFHSYQQTRPNTGSLSSGLTTYQEVTGSRKP